MPRHDVIEISYKPGTKRPWWRIKSSNGKIIAHSSQTYNGGLKACRRAAAACAKRWGCLLRDLTVEKSAAAT